MDLPQKEDDQPLGQHAGLQVFHQRHDGNYTAAQCNIAYQVIHDNLLDQICMAFMVNFLPPELRNKVMDKKPTMMAESAEYAA